MLAKSTFVRWPGSLAGNARVLIHPPLPSWTSVCNFHLITIRLGAKVPFFFPCQPSPTGKQNSPSSVSHRRPGPFPLTAFLNDLPEPGWCAPPQSGLGKLTNRLAAEDPALDFGRRGVLRFEASNEVVTGLPRIDRLAAGKDINRCETDLWPRVDREMRLGDHHDAADALRTKLVKRDLPHLGARLQSGLDHDPLHRLPVVEQLRVTSKGLAQNVAAKGRSAHRAYLLSWGVETQSGSL